MTFIGCISWQASQMNLKYCRNTIIVSSAKVNLSEYFWLLMYVWTFVELLRNCRGIYYSWILIGYFNLNRLLFYGEKGNKIEKNIEILSCFFLAFYLLTWKTWMSVNISKHNILYFMSHDFKLTQSDVVQQKRKVSPSPVS